LNAAACMTRELAESGSGFVITIINECDLVPCFSSGSLDDLRAEVRKCYCILSLLSKKPHVFLKPEVYSKKIEVKRWKLRVEPWRKYSMFPLKNTKEIHCSFLELEGASNLALKK